TPINHVLCENCGYVFVPPPLRMKSDAFYRSSYNFLLDGRDDEPIDMSQGILYSQRLVQFFGAFLQKSPSGTLLDIGAGKGNFLENVHISFPNIDLYALEPSKSFSQLAEKPFLKGAWNEFFAVELFQGRTFDFLSLIGVLEHVEDPRATLNAVRNVMHKESYLLIEVPNFLTNDNDFFTIDHLSKFTPTSINQLFSVVGLEIVESSAPDSSVPMQYVVRLSSEARVDMKNSKGVIEMIHERAKYGVSLVESAKALGEKKLALYGKTPLALYLVTSDTIHISDVRCMIDDNPFYAGRTWQSQVPIMSFEEFSRSSERLPVLLTLSNCYHKYVIQKLQGFQVFGVRNDE
ncbi:MAG: class I SAM-dependent methyltransferase, partial [Bdellovibrionales bacterium]|nr:class I SAM-dependent methyltransferase [Bdellovibrionales bacterium]